MSETSRPARYARFLALAGVVVLLIGGVGYVPTRRLAGLEAIPAMAVGCAISLAAAAMAGWLVVATPAETPVARMQRAFLAMTVRLAIVVVLGVAAVLSGVFPPMPLLFWLATTYVVLLPLEVKLAIRERS
jgi:phosphatidylserine synthase